MAKEAVAKEAVAKEAVAEAYQPSGETSSEMGTHSCMRSLIGEMRATTLPPWAM